MFNSAEEASNELNAKGRAVVSFQIECFVMSLKNAKRKK